MYVISICLALFAGASGFRNSACAEQVVISSEMQFNYAAMLVKDQDYETAVTEFKRFIHFFPQSPCVEKARFMIGVCLFRLKKYRRAAEVLNKIIIRDRQDRITEQACFLQARAFLSLGNSGYAAIIMENYLKLAKDTETRDKIYFMLARIHIKEAKELKKGALELALDSLSKISEPGKLKYHTYQYKDIIMQAGHAAKKNPRAAGIFALIPGAGFLYCGRYQDALVSFLLNTGLICAAVKAYESSNIPLAGLIAFVETGFYPANIYGSISSAYKYNRKQASAILSRQFYISPSLDLENHACGVSINYRF